jgi:hypothetical protein
MDSPQDGYFGLRTEKAVVKFQRDANLTADGIAGPATWAALQPPAKAVPPAAKPATCPSFADWLVNIAKRDVGKVETPRNNQGAWIKRFWPSTSYPDGYSNREPYCAAALAFWLDTAGDELAKAGLLESLTGMTAEQFEKWRCKSAGAWAWQAWGQKAKGVTVLPDSATPQKGDIVVFDFSHIGLVLADQTSARAKIKTIEGNTNGKGARVSESVRPGTSPASSTLLPSPSTSSGANCSQGSDIRAGRANGSWTSASISALASTRKVLRPASETFSLIRYPASLIRARRRGDAAAPARTRR